MEFGFENCVGTLIISLRRWNDLYSDSLSKTVFLRDAQPTAVHM